MDRIGAQEVQFPALLPRELYEATGRWTEYGDNLFRLKDRKGGDYLLGPTHEEMFTLMVKGEYSSYKDLPVIALPDPDQVPRRGPSARRHPARPRVHDEGLLLLRSGRRGPEASYERTARPTAGSSRGSVSTTGSSRRLGRDGRLGLRGVSGPAATGEDILCSAPTATTRPTPRPSRAVRRAEIGASHTPAELVLDTPDTPTIDTPGRGHPRMEASGAPSPPPTR